MAPYTPATKATSEATSTKSPFIIPLMRPNSSNAAKTISITLIISDLNKYKIIVTPMFINFATLNLLCQETNN